MYRAVSVNLFLQGKKLATCFQNVSDTWGSDIEPVHSVASYVCQSMFVPSDSLGHKTVITTQPANLADQLIG